ncbi:MAG: LytTR family transcriptional regulator [Lachnospiraceae bacterium]|nr:LytTR family transcriptional regulator [Lachnospiraceae bacterium]
MITLGILGKKKEENQLLYELSKELIALYSEEKWEISVFNTVNAFNDYLNETDILNVLFIDVTIKGAIEFATKIRNKHKETVILLLADNSISPVKYIKPSIMAAALLLRPLNEVDVREQISNVLELFSNEEKSDDGRFCLEYKGEKVYVPYEHIVYFESREKKIFLGMENKEYGFYGTMNSLYEQLPEGFVRCSQSHIFNYSKVKHISLTDSYVELVKGITIPISRRYKKLMKEL